MAQFFQSRIAVDAARNANGAGHGGGERAVERRAVTCVAVTQKINAVSALGKTALRLKNHFFRCAMQYRRTTRHLPHKGHVAHTAFAAKSIDRVKIQCAHQIITAAGCGCLRPAQTFFLRVGNYFQTGGFTAGLHAGKQRLHLSKGNSLLLKSPKAGAGFLALLKNLSCIGHRTVIIRQHNDQFGSVFHSQSHFYIYTTNQYTLEPVVLQGFTM